jgi:RNA polymerase sigma-70 factor (ECF subfamily)
MARPATGATDRERELVKAAAAGDEGAYRRLVEPLRAELHAHCYRMLGSVHDAEDALQDALLKAWRGLRGFQGRSSPRAWLYRIATNACLDAIARRPRRVLPPERGPAAAAGEGPGAPLAESVWVEPYPDELIGVEDGPAAPEARYERRESVELAFIAALQHLPARQRAALILRDVLGFSARETAESLDTTVASANSALQRARKAAGERLPAESQQATLRALGEERLAEIVDGYVEAWERGDVEAIVAMLAEDAVVAMPPMPTWYAGREAIAGFLRMAFAGPWTGTRFEEGRRRVRLVRGRASGQLALGAYGWDERRGAYRPYALQVLTLRGDRIADITGFVTPETLPAVGLPAELVPSPTSGAIEEVLAERAL